MAIENLEIQKADFEHTLTILPHGDSWYVYINDPKQWWRAYDSLDRAMSEVASTLERVLVHEQGQKIKYARHPLSGNGSGSFPAQGPRRYVRVTADCGEEQAEWHVEMLDDSAWLTSGYDLRECLSKLGRRLVANSGTPAVLLPQPSKTTGVAATILPQPARPIGITAASGGNVTPPHKTIPVPPAGSIEDVMTARLDALGPEIAETEKRLRDVTAEMEKRLRELRRERQALSAARTAYRNKAYSHQKAPE